MSPTRRRSFDRFDDLHRRRNAKVVAVAAALTLASGAAAFACVDASAGSTSGGVRAARYGVQLEPTVSPTDPAASPPASDPASPPASDPASPPASDPASPPASDPASPPASDPASPPASDPASPPASDPAASPSPSSSPPALEILGNNCDNSKLEPHTGFQDGNRCVSTAFGEVASQDKDPSLLITSAPRVVRVNQAFDITVSTRNLVRDRFLKAADGGYYKESAFLTADGLTRGHFHTACRMLAATDGAPDPAPVPAFFKATEDGKGGADPDTVTITVTGLPQAGIAQCASWAGDGSHRIPMMQRANQIPAFDSVRIRVF